MKVSTSWLSDYISLENVDINELAEQITRSGIEIDSVESVNKGVTKVVVGYVKTKEKHPDADKLNIVTVDAGQEEELQIVCGAKNIDAGQKVPIALVGAKLPGGLEIKKAKLRGVPSQGMVCSAKELGLNDKLLPKDQQEGILVLPPETQIGTPIEQVLDLNNQILDFDLTPNRSDCLSMLGAAYEVGAILAREIKLPEANIVENSAEAADSISVKISNPEFCSHFAVRVISNVKIGRSPQWMQNRLMAAGIRPINNVVDVTNYVMLEYGQPLHAYDADRIAGSQIEVRVSREGETIETLDGQERKLPAGALLITDAEKPIGLAGVMGGANSEVTEDTVNIVLEAAKFDGGVVRKLSRLFGLRSEASQRFEKEVDPNRVIPALNRAAALIAELAGCTVHHGIVESGGEEVKPLVIPLSLAKLNQFLGTDISTLEVKTILSRLHFESGDLPDNTLEVKVPTRRGDITRDVDLIEEVARLYGYDEIPTTSIEGPTTQGGYTESQLLRRGIRTMLTNGGLQEVLSYSFANREAENLFPTLKEDRHSVKLAMPMSEDRSVLRTSLIPQLVDVTIFNRNRKQENLALFEIGSVFQTSEETLTVQPKEIPMLGILMTGLRQEKQWNLNPDKVDFYDLKGAVETVIGYWGLEGRISYEADRPEGFHPGRSASIFLENNHGKERIGVLGQIHPDVQRSKELDDTYVAEIKLESLFAAEYEAIEYRDLPRFPSVQRDIAVVVDQGVTAAELLKSIRENTGELLEHVNVFDIFTGSKLGEGKKSVALSLVYRHMERTLTDEEITEVHGRAVAGLEQTFGAELRK
ncbi:phenylalanine--tRNA ligase subunit beta [Paenibacillus physcomitrellae]|uniref:Phenylalanine--tRNA ligase beta subunit n=1 Tax=Paenibacillus physcomitrellae TaxID=1619311 RepID=A0ABQ1G7D5_9BACL|nr:phenylalanine--tRNA ligase subunit beta [Paenibacillus physcomitrellae]GGA38168.1 phenylalanine--tRNA ligase beta subunit [Paenibacillus physcomitrellae]